PLGFGCARIATLAFAPPHPKGVKLEGRKTNYRSRFTPAGFSLTNGLLLFDDVEATNHTSRFYRVVER
ncbi:MAG: hypothetical protein RL514_1939, partial [Verrucomicrobiota bacterium]